ncbi:MAG TPA: hypothetical protein VHE30_02275 [Polyangiaceae bacterium]|nr:hypothetical protein [Polyangiaceae bacterium]
MSPNAGGAGGTASTGGGPGAGGADSAGGSGGASPIDRTPLDPDTAPKVTVDRFSEKAAMLMVRTAENGLPAAGAPVDFDTGEPFITKGLGPNGEHVQYYNFDVQPTKPAPIYALFRTGEDKPVDGQLNIVDVVPGDTGYNDFWQVEKVTVPADYVANTITSVSEILDAGYDVTPTDMLVNCPIVPDGSTAKLRYKSTESAELTRGWYRDQVVYYFNFFEADLVAAAGKVPTSPIYVTFNVNPGDPGGGPASGFVVEPGTAQTHNVPATLPTDPGYSPLWAVHIYDDTAFASVMDLDTATSAKLLEPNGPTVNCPIVSVQ